MHNSFHRNVSGARSFAFSAAPLYVWNSLPLNDSRTYYTLSVQKKN